MKSMQQFVDENRNALEAIAITLDPTLKVYGPKDLDLRSAVYHDIAMFEKAKSEKIYDF